MLGDLYLLEVRAVRGVGLVVPEPVDAQAVEELGLRASPYTPKIAGEDSQAVDLHGGSTRAIARHLRGSGSGREGHVALVAREGILVREPLLLVHERPLFRSRELNAPPTRAPRQLAKRFLQQREIPDHALSLEVTPVLLAGLLRRALPEARVPFRVDAHVKMFVGRELQSRPARPPAQPTRGAERRFRPRARRARTPAGPPRWRRLRTIAVVRDCARTRVRVRRGQRRKKIAAVGKRSRWCTRVFRTFDEVRLRVDPAIAFERRSVAPTVTDPSPSDGPLARDWIGGIDGGEAVASVRKLRRLGHSCSNYKETLRRLLLRRVLRVLRVLVRRNVPGARRGGPARVQRVVDLARERLPVAPAERSRHMTPGVEPKVFRFRVGGKLRVLFHGLERAQVLLVEQGRQVGVGRVLVAGEGVQDLSLLLVRRGGAVAGHGARGCGVSDGCVSGRRSRRTNAKEKSRKPAGGRARATRRVEHRA